MKSLPLIFTLTLAALAFTQDQSITAGPIDFYGYAGLDLNQTTGDWYKGEDYM